MEQEKEKVIVLHIVEKQKLVFWKNFLWDKMQFVLISALVFVISYGALNYQAIAEVIKYKFQKSQIEKIQEIPLLSDKLKTSVLLADDVGTASVKKIFPKLDIAIYPPDTRIVIPRILKNIPVVGISNESLIKRDWDQLDKDIKEALQSGVVHYPGAAMPGEKGNAVFTGHSSYYAWDPGRFKDVFALLHEMKLGDKVYIFHNQKKFVYEVFDIRVVKPKDVDVLAQTDDERITLITCTPLGTNLKRLIVSGRRVS